MKAPVFVLLIAVILFVVFAILSFVGSSGIMGAAAIASLLCGLFALILLKILERVNPKVWIITGLVVLAGLLMSTSYRSASLMNDLFVNTTFLIPFALINAAFLFYSGLQFSFSEANAELGSQRPLPGMMPMITLSLGLLLVVIALRNLYSLTVWDNTHDSVGSWLFIPLFATLLSGLTLLIALPSRAKLAGLLYILILPIVLITVSSQARKVDFRALTSQRADRVVQAIESFYAREGRYPESLSDLTPRFILALPEPVIIYGQTWCYESGDGYYRLGYVDREHWSDPRLIGRIHKEEGQPPGQSLMCAAEVATIQQSTPDYPYTYWKESR